MSLYEYSLFNIFNQLNKNTISYKELEDQLPEDILNDLNKYLINLNELETSFYESIKSKHFIFAGYFLKKIINNFLDIVNNGLKYCIDVRSVEFLMKYGANDWDKGLLGAVFNNNLHMIEYFIKLGADDFNDAMLQAIIKNNTKLINYFINIGADDFNNGLLTATEMNNTKLIKFFIEQGADDFDAGLYTAARYGLNDLILFYIDLGANDYMTALGGAIDNNHYSDLLISPLDKIKPCIVGEAFLYFLNNTIFESVSGTHINHLLSYLMKGYATKETLKLIMKLYLYNKHFNYDDEYYTDPYYIAFGKMPSLNQKIVQKNKTILQLNTTKDTTFINIKKYHKGFYSDFIDRIYFPEIIELNIYRFEQLSKEEKLFLMNPDTTKQLWIEYMIVKATLDFYD
jgi:hypothetical protein